MYLYSLAFFSPFLAPNRGSSDQRQKCFQWQGSCEVCAKMMKWTFGIFCANFGTNAIGFEVCNKALCGNCYTSASEPEFYVADNDDARTENGDEDRLSSGWSIKKNEENRFSKARNGDDLLVSFECDTCIVLKLFRRFLLTEDTKDIFTMACIR